MRHSSTFATVVLLSALCSLSAQVKKEAVPGVANYAVIETTVGCGGTITPAAVTELKQRGFKSIFNLQLPDERGADLAGEAAAAKAAGVNFVHVPFTPSNPDNASVDRFLAEIRKPSNEPAFIHCAAGNRAAGFWLIKRLVVDKWDTDRAMKEAEALGLTSAQMKQFAQSYAESHRQ
jgi:uncharacterized protein (TIGR01244 family)